MIQDGQDGRRWRRVRLALDSSIHSDSGLGGEAHGSMHAGDGEASTAPLNGITVVLANALVDEQPEAQPQG